MIAYTTAAGERLVVQGSRNAVQPERRIRDVRAALARRTGTCSVCELPADVDELDASGRCRTCQP